jgi:hypothetical protein
MWRSFRGVWPFSGRRLRPAILPSGDDRRRRFGDAREAVDYSAASNAHLAD